MPYRDDGGCRRHVLTRAVARCGDCAAPLCDGCVSFAGTCARCPPCVARARRRRQRSIALGAAALLTIAIGTPTAIYAFAPAPAPPSLRLWTWLNQEDAPHWIIEPVRGWRIDWWPNPSLYSPVHQWRDPPIIDPSVRNLPEEDLLGGPARAAAP
jgi:hypothetical protein